MVNFNPLIYKLVNLKILYRLKKLTSRGGVEDTRLEAKDTKKIRGQGQPFRGQTLSRPRTQAQVLSKKKRSSQKFFRRSPQKYVFQKIFQALHKLFTIQKIVLSSSRGQAIFEAKDFKMCPRGLHLW